MKILIAEDGEDHARILIAVLRQHGYETFRAENGLQALEMLGHDTFDLLITDIMMPGMSGFELLLRLKQDKIEIPVLVLTSKQREEDVLRGLESGAADYVVKPFSPSVVLAKVKKILAGKAA